MKRTLMIGVAAGALLAGVSFAGAQGMDRQQLPGASGGASVEQKGEVKGKKARGNAEMNAQGGAEMKGGKARAQGELNAQGGAEVKGKAKAKSDAELKGGAEIKGGKARAQAPAGGEMKAQETQKPGMKAGTTTQTKEPSAGTSAQGDTKASGSATTTGQAGAGAKATLTAEQKTKVRETVFKSGPRVTNVNFSLSIGTVVPRTVRFATLPPILVEYYPQWRGYEYFIVEEEIIIVEPRTLKIVAVIVV